MALAHQVVWQQCNVFVDDKPITLARGQSVPDEVDAEQLDRLVIVGAVQPVAVADEPVRKAAAK